MATLYLPIQKENSSSEGRYTFLPDRVTAIYLNAHSPVDGCSRENDLEFVSVEPKSWPPKSKFRDDAVKNDPAHNKVLLENNRVRVVRIHFLPGESGPTVDKRMRVIVPLTDSHAMVTFPDGHSEVRDVKAGSISFGVAGRQATKNTGTTPLENIVVELKSKQ